LRKIYASIIKHESLQWDELSLRRLLNKLLNILLFMVKFPEEVI